MLQGCTLSQRRSGQHAGLCPWRLQGQALRRNASADTDAIGVRPERAQPDSIVRGAPVHGLFHVWAGSRFESGRRRVSHVDSSRAASPLGDAR